MFSMKKTTMILKYIVSRISIAAFVVVVGMAGTAAAARPIVTSTSPTDDAINVPVNTTVTVNFSEPMNCNTINRNNFRLKDVRHGRLAAETITCSGTSATLTPVSDLAVSTRYEVVLHGKIRSANGKLLWDNGWGYDFTTAPNSEPPATATPTATATPPLLLRRQPQPRRQRLRLRRLTQLQPLRLTQLRPRQLRLTRRRPPQLTRLPRRRLYRDRHRH